MENQNDESVSIPSKRGNFVFRQEFISLTPRCTASCSIICLAILIVIFLACGIPILILGNSVLEYSFDYTNW
jgi:hypothetical protein